MAILSIIKFLKGRIYTNEIFLVHHVCAKYGEKVIARIILFGELLKYNINMQTRSPYMVQSVCVRVLNCKQQQCRTWIHFTYLHRIFVFDFHGFSVIMYVQTM